MFNVLISGSISLVTAVARDILLCSWARHLSTGRFDAEGDPMMD